MEHTENAWWKCANRLELILMSTFLRRPFRYLLKMSRNGWNLEINTSEELIFGFKIQSNNMSIFLWFFLDNFKLRIKKYLNFRAKNDLWIFGANYLSNFVTFSNLTFINMNFMPQNSNEQKMWIFAPKTTGEFLAPKIKVILWQFYS